MSTVRLAGAGVTDQAQRLTLLDAFAAGQGVDGRRVDGWVGVVIEVSEPLFAGKPRRPDPAHRAAPIPVVEEAQHLGGPALLVLEDVDLWCQSRHSGYGGGLSELLQATDIAAEARILTLASTNDAATLDEAAIRTGRFDAIVGVGYPTRTDAARILISLITHLAGADTVGTHAVAASVPEQTSGSDLREILRRAVLSADETGVLSTAALLAEVGSERYRATIPNRMYL
jgi:hypothetical protein